MVAKTVNCINVDTDTAFSDIIYIYIHIKDIEINENCQPDISNDISEPYKSFLKQRKMMIY